MKKLFLIPFLFSCEKETEPTIFGSWKTNETIYEFSKDLTITQDGIEENYLYSISNDTIYLNYGFPFFIEKLDHGNLSLSKNDGTTKYWYDFDRISL